MFARTAIPIILFVLFTSPAFSTDNPEIDGLKITVPLGKSYDYRKIKVNRVVDGDTLELENGDRVRLIGIDSPENRTSAKAKVDSRRTGQPLRMIKRDGRKAAKFLKELVEGKEVRLEFDTERLDSSGRVLAYVFKFECNACKIKALPGYEYQQLDDGLYLFVNTTMVSSGYAGIKAVPPNILYADDFSRLLKQARDYKQGLWGAEEE